MVSKQHHQVAPLLNRPSFIIISTYTNYHNHNNVFITIIVVALLFTTTTTATTTTTNIDTIMAADNTGNSATSATSASAASSSSTSHPVSFYFLPGVNTTVYSQPGDITIGALVYVYENGEPFAERCGARVKASTTPIEITESIAFAVNWVNRNPAILPNVTLGFVLRGVCASRNVGVATALSFLPRARLTCNSSNSISNATTTTTTTTSTTTNGNSSAAERCYTSPMTSPPSDSPWLSHDVIGVLGSGYSSVSLAISTLYAVAGLPFLGLEETSDDFSNKRDHPSFFRMGPPDVYQVRALLQFISENGWSYISVLYSEGAYGENAFKNVLRNSDNYGICVATSRVILYSTDYDEVVQELLSYPRARVVVLFLVGSRFYQLLKSAHGLNATGHFIWIGSDSINTYRGYNTYYNDDDDDDKGISIEAHQDPAIGAFSFDHYTAHIDEFYAYLQRRQKQQSASNDAAATGTTTEEDIPGSNPWLKRPYEFLLGCSYEEGTCDPDADILRSPRYRTGKAAPLRIDAVLTLAQAAHNLLAERCPDARGEEARACITRETFHEYLKNVDLEGYNGRVRFDENQDVRGKYLITQFVYDYVNNSPVTAAADDNTNNTTTTTTSESKSKSQWKMITKRRIGTFDTLANKVSYFGNNPMTWSHANVLKRVVPWTADNDDIDDNDDSGGSSSVSPLPAIEMIPESVCSRPCVAGEYKIEKDVPCCWDCRTCRENERLVNGNTSCEACPPFLWPDPSSGFTTCVDIPPSYPELDDTLPIVLISLACVFLAIDVVTTVLYVRYRNERVIKASSKELSGLQLVAVFAGYLTIVLFQTKPNDVMCGLIFFVFCMSFSLLYCPLLVKAVRIYRIFQNGAKVEKPRFISPHSQLVFSICLIAVQVVLCMVVYFLFWPRARLSQPIWSERFVELSCDLTFPGMTSFLGYNIVLVSLCSVLAFMTRKLPDNFNESKFISMCVSTTLLIWLAFVPTYFTADREFVRVFLLSMALLLNHSVALLLLFVPKLYAAIFIVPPSKSTSDSAAGTFSKAR